MEEMRMYIELSHRLIESQLPDEVLNLPGLSIEWRSKFGDGRNKSNQTSIIKIFSHHGTHIDVPFHVYENGFMMSDFDAGDFMLENPAFIECPKTDLQNIEVIDLLKHREKLDNSDSLFVYTKFSEHRNDRKRYVENSPSFSKESLEYLLDTFPRIRCLGMDLFSVENIHEGRSLKWPVHRSFLKPFERRYIIEDMNLKPLLDRELTKVITTPLFFANEACPVTVVAQVRETRVEKGGN